MLNIENLYYSGVIEDLESNNKFTYLTELSNITIKSLIPFENNIGNGIDYKRYLEELKLWKFYRSGYNYNTINIWDIKEDVYYKNFDETAVYRIIPIIVSNSKLEVMIKEVIKNILYFSGNIKTLMKNLVLAVYIHFLYETKCLEIAKNKSKDFIIKFGYDEFKDTYERYFRYKVENEKLFIIKFEKEKINILDILNKGSSEEFTMEYILGNKRFIIEVLSKDIYKENLPNFFWNMGVYLQRLRKSKIPPESIVIKKYILPDIFKFEEGEIFYHSLLGKSKVIKKIYKEGNINILLKTKSGYYALNKEK